MSAHGVALFLLGPLMVATGQAGESGSPSSYACYRSLISGSTDSVKLAGGAASVEYQSEFVFWLLDDRGVRHCTVPTNAMMSAGSRASAGRYVSVELGEGRRGYIEYGRASAEVDDYKDMPAGTFVAAHCTVTTGSDDSGVWRDLIKHHLERLQQDCREIRSPASCAPAWTSVQQACTPVLEPKLLELLTHILPDGLTPAAKTKNPGQSQGS